MKNNTENVQCPKCKMEVNSEATKCPHCRSKISKSMSNIVKIFLGLLFGGVMFSMILADNNSTSTQTTTTTSPVDSMQVGDSGTVHLPNNNDPKQKICLGETRDDADAIMKSLTATDYLGILENPGAFCVSNGTKVLLTEKHFPYRKVRIMGVINKIDDDKVGQAGWLPMEWVTK